MDGARTSIGRPRVRESVRGREKGGAVEDTTLNEMPAAYNMQMR